MKLDIRFRFDIYTLLIWIVLIIIIGFTYKALIGLQLRQIELDTLIENNKAYAFDYSCDSGFDSKFYNCPTNESLRNITGSYCYGEIICQNSIRKLDKLK